VHGQYRDPIGATEVEARSNTMVDDGRMRGQRLREYPGSELQCLNVVRRQLVPEAPAGIEREQFARVTIETRGAMPVRGVSVARGLSRIGISRYAASGSRQREINIVRRRVKKLRIIPPVEITCRMDEDFAELVGRAYWQFETLTLLVTQRLNPRVGEQILVIDPTKTSRVRNYEHTIVTALAHSYVFNVRRMYRIIHGDSYFLETIDRLAQRSFDAHMQEIINVRDIYEHGFDPRTSSPRNRIATPYRNPVTGLEAGSFFQDETGVRYSVPTAEFFMGQLNLTQAHLGVMRM
jgi:hypothetical protein